MDSLRSTAPWYIRCVRPNTTKAPNSFDNDLILIQLQYSGVLETIKIRKNGYGFRYNFQYFQAKYRAINLKLQPNASSIKSLLESQKVDPKTWLIGKTKVFLRDVSMT